MANYCNYKDCENIQRSFSSKVFFNLPTDSRRDIWIKNSGNDKLKDLGPAVRRVFCEDHFDPKYLRRQFNRTLLRREAVPYPYSEESQQVEFIEMAESEEDTYQNEIDAIDIAETVESTNTQNDTIVLLNKKRVRMQAIPSEIVVRRGQIETLASDVVEIEDIKPLKSIKRDLDAQLKDNVEIDFIVLEENSQETVENDVNEIEVTPKKRIRIGQSSQQEKVAEIVREESKSTLKLNAVSKGSIDGVVSSTETVDSNSEETYFALSLVGILKRLPPHKRAIAKCHILSYLTELEYGSSSIS